MIEIFNKLVSYLGEHKRALRRFLVLFINVTVCTECYRGRLAFMFAIGALCGGNGWLAIVGFLIAFVFTGRKHKWWIN